MTTPGPNELELRKVLKDKIDNDGLMNVHISWGPKAAEMTVEERCRYVIDHVLNRDTSKDVLVTAAELDRAALAPEVFPATWEAMTRIERRREIARVAKERANATIG